ncbi:MAG: arylesterase [Gammaproteobacteria bacterium]|nr:arylesterase [Gammaproteobacteria bacterium]
MSKLFKLLCLLMAGLSAQTLNATTVLVFGDSLSAAYRLNPVDGWVNLLQRKADREKLDLTFINASISGETTRGGLSRFNQTFEKNKPDIVILELGANDGLRGFPPKVIKHNLQTMIDFAQDHNAKTLLVGIYLPPNYGKHYTAKFQDVYVSLSSQYQLPLIPYLLEGVGTDQSLMQADGLHPNAKGQPVIAETVWQSLKSMLVSPALPDTSMHQANTAEKQRATN